MVYNLEDELERKLYSDQTGRFPKRSYKGMQYVMGGIEHVSNEILFEPLLNCTSGEIVAAYQNIVDKLKDANIKPTMHILDNKISTEFTEAI